MRAAFDHVPRGSQTRESSETVLTEIFHGWDNCTEEGNESSIGNNREEGCGELNGKNQCDEYSFDYLGVCYSSVDFYLLVRSFLINVINDSENILLYG